MEALAASGRAETEEVRVVCQLVFSFFSCYVDSHRYPLTVSIIYLQRGFLAVLDTLFVHQTHGRVTECQKAVIVLAHAVAVTGEGTDKQFQLVISPFADMDAQT